MFSALLEDSAEDLYEHAPCGYLSTTLDGRIAKINHTLLQWLGYESSDLVGRRDFSDLLTVGGRLYHETHFGPLLRLQGEVSGIALELKTADGGRLPVLVTSVIRTGSDGQPLLIRTTVFDARDRRTYETELLRARQESDRERERLKRLNATLQKTLLPPPWWTCPDWTSPPTTTSLPSTRSAATSTTCSPSPPAPGDSSWATSAARALPPRPSPPSRATHCAPPPCTTPSPRRCSPTSTPS